MSDRIVEVYKDDAGEFRWRLKAPNHEVVADSGEGYTRKDDLLEAVEREFPGLPVVFAGDWTGDDQEAP